MKRFTRYFLRGLFILGPVIITAYVSVVIFRKLDDLVFARLGNWVKGLLPGDVVNVGATVLGVASCVLLITLAGMVASNFVGRQLLDWFERILDRVPLVKLLYRSLKDLMGAFVGEKKGFETPVFVALGGEAGAAKVIGFITRQDAAFLGAAGHVAVYLPQSYNFAGQVVVVPGERLTPVKLNKADAMTFVVSGGVSGVAHEDLRGTEDP